MLSADQKQELIALALSEEGIQGMAEPLALLFQEHLGELTPDQVSTLLNGLYTNLGKKQGTVSWRSAELLRDIIPHLPPDRIPPLTHRLVDHLLDPQASQASKDTIPFAIAQSALAAAIARTEAVCLQDLRKRLVQPLAHQNENIRVAACRLLGAIAARSEGKELDDLIGPIKAMLQNNLISVWSACCQALGSASTLANPAQRSLIIQTLLDLLKNNDWVHDSASEALRLACSHAQEEEPVDMCAEAIRHLSSGTFTHFREGQFSAVAILASHCLSQMDNAIAMLTQFLHHYSGKKNFVYHTLGILGPCANDAQRANITNTLTLELDNPKWEDSWAACRALRGIVPLIKGSPLNRILSTVERKTNNIETEEQYTYLRQEACWIFSAALPQVDAEKTYSILRVLHNSALRDPDLFVRRDACYALGHAMTHVSTTYCTYILIILMEKIHGPFRDQDSQVYTAAIEAMAKLPPRQDTQIVRHSLIDALLLQLTIETDRSNRERISKTLAELAFHSPADTRINVAQALIQQSNSPYWYDSLDSVCSRLLKLLSSLESAQVKALLLHLKETNPQYAVIKLHMQALISHAQPEPLPMMEHEYPHTPSSVVSPALTARHSFKPILHQMNRSVSLPSLQLEPMISPELYDIKSRSASFSQVESRLTTMQLPDKAVADKQATATHDAVKDNTPAPIEETKTPVTRSKTTMNTASSNIPDAERKFLGTLFNPAPVTDPKPKSPFINKRRIVIGLGMIGLLAFALATNLGPVAKYFSFAAFALGGLVMLGLERYNWKQKSKAALLFSHNISVDMPKKREHTSPQPEHSPTLSNTVGVTHESEMKRSSVHKSVVA